ncbi:MAG: alpha/beta hydrolase [Deltaproteobacteria bacterium]|nr:alpha/beta hydrolase [Deltaproteobacteria bacterium]
MPDWVENDIAVNNVNIHYCRTGGDKPPLILLHGVTDNGLCWTPAAEVLEERYDVIMVDAQGHGRSGRVDPNFSGQSHVDHVAGLVKDLKLDKPVLMGHSMGGSTAANIAAQHPDLPRAIILEDPGWRGRVKSGPDQDNGNQTANNREQSRLFEKWIADLQKQSLEEVVQQGRENSPAWSEKELVPWAESKLLFDPAVFSGLSPGGSSYQKVVPHITCPILLITSDPDKGGIVSPETAEHASTLWGKDSLSEWVRIEGAGHNIRREQFEAYMSAVLNFSDKIR